MDGRHVFVLPGQARDGPGRKVVGVPGTQRDPHPYEDLLRLVLDHGTPKSDRTGTRHPSLFGHQLRWRPVRRFPLITTKKVHTKSVIYELLWFLRGDSNVEWLQHHGVTIWDEWAKFHRGSGSGLRGAVAVVADAPSGEHVDQISAAVDLLRTDPDSRRIIVSAWNVADLPRMALAPCHAFFQFYVADGRLSCQLYQRSADMFPRRAVHHRQLRVAHMMAVQAGLDVGTSSGPAATAISTTTTSSRSPNNSAVPRRYPELVLHRGIRSSTTPDDIEIRNYDPHRRSRPRWRYEACCGAESSLMSARCPSH